MALSNTSKFWGEGENVENKFSDPKLQNGELRHDKYRVKWGQDLALHFIES